jgi:hypothetical protein
MRGFVSESTNKTLPDRLNELGYKTVSELFASYPGEPFGRVYRRLFDGTRDDRSVHFPMMFLKLSYEREAKESGKLRLFAIDSLVRSFVEHGGPGWRKGSNWNDRLARVYSSWHVPAGHDAECTRVWDALKQLDPPIGWKPTSVEDEILARAFQAGWPV